MACAALTPTIPAALATTSRVASENTDVVWMNIRDFPTSLFTPSDTFGWSAIRSEPPDFTSFRIAADDFILESETTITKITFFSVENDPPTIIGGDWYIYANDGTGTGGPGEPGTLIAFEAAAPLTRTLFGENHPTFGNVFENVIEPQDLTLPAGRYFLAFRTFQSIPLPIVGRTNNAALTERWTNGSHRALWNMDVFGNGFVAGAWEPIGTFNLIDDQEWAFILEGNPVTCYPDCDQSTGVGTLDLFDFLCFQGSFVSGEAYACDCDTSTGPLVCDLFDFLCFQGEFVGGCP